MDSTTSLLKELTEAYGVPGYEAPVRAVVRQYLEPFGELTQDKIGSVICSVTGDCPAPKVMLAAHMDEIGFMVKQISPEGFLSFLPLGGWYDQVLLGQRVVIHTRRPQPVERHPELVEGHPDPAGGHPEPVEGQVVGVIGARPPHLLTAEDRDKVVKKKDMYIDIGATSREEVEAAGVRPGDPITPRADFVPLANGKTFLSKAFDDRVGVALIISALRELQGQPHPNTLYGVATVMEEVGPRGAVTAVHAVDPDVAIVLESDIAGDVPGIKPEESSVKLGKGPSMLFYDASMIPNLKLRDLVLEVAREAGIPVQVSFIQGGATDGSAIHLHHTGVPTVVLAVPARHIHSHSSIIHRDDYDQAVNLLVALVKRLDASTVAGLTAANA